MPSLTVNGACSFSFHCSLPESFVFLCVLCFVFTFESLFVYPFAVSRSVTYVALYNATVRRKQGLKWKGEGMDKCFLLNHRVIIIITVVFIIEYQFIHVNLCLVSSVVHACFFSCCLSPRLLCFFLHSFIHVSYMCIYHK